MQVGKGHHVESGEGGCGLLAGIILPSLLCRLSYSYFWIASLPLCSKVCMSTAQLPNFCKARHEYIIQAHPLSLFAYRFLLDPHALLFHTFDNLHSFLQGPTRPALLSFVYFSSYSTLSLHPCSIFITTTMRSFFSALAVVPSLLGSAFLAHAAPSGQPDLASGLVSRASTCNTASNRACWTTGFDINTDYEASTPTTGITRHVCPHTYPYVDMSNLQTNQLSSTPSL